MPWTVGITRLIAGLFLANAVPHFVKGVTGEPFPTPFAHPPGRGRSSPLTNVLWGWLNLIVAGFFLSHPGPFHAGWNLETLWLMIGIGIAGIGLALFFRPRPHTPHPPPRP